MFHFLETKCSNLLFPFSQKHQVLSFVFFNAGSIKAIRLSLKNESLLNEALDLAVEEERYEDAAKIRDYLKK